MRIAHACWCLVLCAAACAAQTELTPGTLLLARIKVHMEENLTRLSNYTCLQTIERSRRLAPSRRYELVDVLRLEVALIGQKELFSWPGEEKFQESEIFDFVQGGAIGNGNFALHAYSVFFGEGPLFTYVGERERDGRKTIRYDYQVPLTSSGYKIRVRPNEAVVAYHGSLWADAETLDLIRLEVYSEDLPPILGLSATSNSINYGRTRIGESDFLLPQSSELQLTDIAGNENRNLVRFSDCRQFAGKSYLSFGEAPETAAPAAVRPLSEVRLPAGLALELELEADIRSEKSFVGGPVTARVRRDVRKDGVLYVPKGARVTGRIVCMEQSTTRRRALTVGLQFRNLEFDGKRAPFEAGVEYVASLVNPKQQPLGASYQSPRRPGEIIFVKDASSQKRPGLFQFQVDGDRVYLPRGFLMIWRTANPVPPEKP